MANQNGNKSYGSHAKPHRGQPLVHESVENPNLPCPACLVAEATVRPAHKVAIFVLLFLGLMLAPMAKAATTYKTTATVNFVDNMSNCKYPQTLAPDCFTTMPGTLKQISAGSDGTVYGVNSSNHTYALTPGSAATAAFWTYVPALNAQIVAVQDATHIYGLVNNGSCPAGYYQAMKANATLSGWVSTASYGCGQNITVGYDGTLLVQSNGTLYFMLAGSTTWTSPITGSAWSGMIAVYDKTLAVGVKANAVYKFNPSTATSTALVGGLAGGAPTSVALGQDGLLWMTGAWIPQDTANIYSLDLLTAGATQTAYYDATYSGFNQVASGGPMFVFTLTASQQIYHYKRYIPTLKVNLSGSYDCGTNGLGCPSGSAHSGFAQAAFMSGGQHGAAGVRVSSRAVNPTSDLGATAIETGMGCDFFNDPGAPGCTPSNVNTQGGVTCSVMGSVYQESPHVEFELAQTYVLKISGVPGAYIVTPSCRNIGSFAIPDFLPGVVKSWSTTATAWQVWGLCERTIAPVKSGWACVPVGLAFQKLDTGGYCTYNP